MKNKDDFRSYPDQYQKMDLVQDDHFGLGVVVDIVDSCYVIRWITPPTNKLARFSSGLSHVPMSVSGFFATAWKTRLKFVCHG